MKCPKCGGSGISCESGSVFCSRCKGTGETRVSREEYIQNCNTEKLIKFFCKNAVEIDCIAGNPHEEEDFKEWLQEEYRE